MTGSSQRRREAAFRAGREDGLAAAEAERNVFKGKYRSIVTLLNTTRQQLQEIFDHVDDEGDRRYFGSTNHVDWLRDLLDDMDGWSIDAILPKGDINKMEADPYAEIRAQRARAEAAEEARAEQWRLRRDAEGSRDTARATADTLRRERDEVRSALKLAIDHIEHMAAWLSGKGTGYSFESLGEDMPGIKAALSAQVQDAPEKVGRFGHHHEPAIDFCIEVEALEGHLFDAKHSIGKPGHEPRRIDDEFRRRVSSAMDFIVGGDQVAIAAKATLRSISAQVQDVATPKEWQSEVTHQDICNTYEGGPCNCDWSAAAPAKQEGGE